MTIRNRIIRGIYKGDTRYWFDAYSCYNFGDTRSQTSQDHRIMDALFKEIKRPKIGGS